MHRITLSRPFGRAKGFVAEPSEFIGYLSRHTTHVESVLGKLTFPSIAVLLSLRVDEEHQGQGLGKGLLLDFEEEADDRGAHAVLLIADKEEGQKQGFVLENFYRINGYHRIAQTSSGPLMLKII